MGYTVYRKPHGLFSPGAFASVDEQRNLDVTQLYFCFHTFGNEFEKGHRKVINWVSWADIKSLIQEGPEGRGHMAAERPPLENARTAI